MNELIGAKVKYIDYLGMVEDGRIIAIELLGQNEAVLHKVSNNTCWVYIQHEDPELNNKQLPDGRTYCELRLSTEIILV